MSLSLRRIHRRSATQCGARSRDLRPSTGGRHERFPEKAPAARTFRGEAARCATGWTKLDLVDQGNVRERCVPRASETSTCAHFDASLCVRQFKRWARSRRRRQLPQHSKHPLDFAGGVQFRLRCLIKHRLAGRPAPVQAHVWLLCVWLLCRLELNSQLTFSMAARRRSMTAAGVLSCARQMMALSASTGGTTPLGLRCKRLFATCVRGQLKRIGRTSRGNRVVRVSTRAPDGLGLIHLPGRCPLLAEGDIRALDTEAVFDRCCRKRARLRPRTLIPADVDRQGDSG
jgi:hypothetical protein